MSMEALTVWQLTGMFCAYLFVTVGLPAFVFGGKLRGHRAPERFMLYFMTGNFCVMNLVFVLQLLHISYPLTLAASTAVLTVVGWIKVNHVPVWNLAKDYTKNLRRLAGGQMGVRTAVYRIGAILKRRLTLFGRWVLYFLCHRFFDCVLIALLLVALWYIYGTNLLDHFGYKASDLLVHNYWINSLNDNDIFVAGVYPYGFHCTLYYLHAVFGIDTYVLLRVFAFVQNVMLHLMLLCVLRLCCRTRYMAYVGTFAFVIGDYFKTHTYSRYYATLPQEFGIIFILPAIYFGFAYFEARRKELREIKEAAAGEGIQEPAKKKAWKKTKKTEQPKQPVAEMAATAQQPGMETAATAQQSIMETTASAPQPEAKPLWGWRKWLRKKPKQPRSKAWMYLAGFCMSFSMTLAVHFYGTMVAGIFCVAMAMGYSFLLFRKQYFWKVVGTASLSVAIAILPMLLAFLGGTPLQGSLGWGMNIIMGTNSKAETEESKALTSDAADDASTSGTSSNGTGSTSSNGVQTSGGTSAGISNGQEIIANQSSQADDTNSLQSAQEEKQRRSLSEFTRQAWKDIENGLKNYVFNLPFKDGVKWIMLSFFGLVALGLLYMLFRQPCYGAILVSTGLYMLLMCCVIMAPSTFGLPSLMDRSRGSIYFSYSYPMAFALFLDGVVYLPFCWMRGRVEKVGRVLTSLASMACVAGFLYYTVAADQLREPRDSGAQEMNEAVICLTNIIETEADFTWTIVSANDELRMGWDHGYHYETITFLQEMENMSSDTMIRIPTPVVYFFIEKIPQDYNVSYEGSGQPISERGASGYLPVGNSIGVYQGSRRWIVMSRMYYWAQAFQNMCPNEMEVYMETDSFICYRVEQNTYRLYNFAIDYGYNIWETMVAKAAD